jgi:hypothetical protein
MEGSEHRDRSDRLASQIRRDVLVDGRQPENVDVQHLAGASRSFEIHAAVGPQTEIQALSDGRLLHDIRMAFELIAYGCPDEVGPVGIEPFLNHQVDVAEIDVPEVDCDLLAVRDPFRHFTIYVPSNWMVYGPGRKTFSRGGLMLLHTPDAE